LNRARLKELSKENFEKIKETITNPIDTIKKVVAAVQNKTGISKEVVLFAMAAVLASLLIAGGYFGYKNYIGSGLYQHMLARMAAKRAEAAEGKIKIDDSKREAETRQRAKALLMFIRGAAVKGYVAKDISKALVSKGWPAKSVESYVKYVFKNYVKEMGDLKEENAVQNYDEEMQDIEEKLNKL
jgi:hypothetical protein